MEFSILVSVLCLLAFFRASHCDENEGVNEELLRRNIMSWVRKPVPVHHFQTPLKMMEEQGLDDEFFIDDQLAQSQATCKLVKLEKRLILEGIVFRPEIIDEIYCINTWNPTSNKCQMGVNMVCEQKKEVIQLSWREEGQENCWKDPIPHEKPAGCHCYIQQ